MIQLSSAGKRYGHKLLFEDADWLITPESRELQTVIDRTLEHLGMARLAAAR